MTIAITGGTGFVGQAVLEEAARGTLLIRTLARTIPAAQGEVEWVQGELSDTKALARLVEGADAILHIAGLTNTPDPSRFDPVNVGGTAAMIAAAKQANVARFVFVSSLAAREPELSQYGASKFRAEELVKASGLDWTIVRPPAVYGPRDTDMLQLFKAARLRIIPLPPGGATSMIHVFDLARLLLTLAPSSLATRHKIYEPDDGREGGWSHQEMAHAIGSAIGRRVIAPHCPKWLLVAAARMERLLRGDDAKLTLDRIGYMVHPNWVVRSSKRVPKEIWEPRIATRNGLTSTARWYREQSWL